MNQAHCCWLRSNMVAVNFPPNFSTKRQILKYARKTKMHYIIFSIFLSFPLPCGFSLLLKYLLWEKYWNYPLTTT